MSVNSSAYNFILAQEPDHFAIARELFLEYARSLDFDLCFQHFDKELLELDEMYNRPQGGIILVKEINSGDYAGCVAIRNFENKIAELKRMYVKPEFRNKGLGEELLLQAIGLAKKLLYKKIRLDTIDSMKAAISLYRKHGFKEIEPYTFNPHTNAKYFELSI